MIDAAGAMTSSMDVARKIAHKQIDELKTTQRFNVLVMQEKAPLLPLGPALIDATPENKRKALDLIDATNARGPNDLVPGMKAVEELHPDLVVMLIECTRDPTEADPGFSLHVTAPCHIISFGYKPSKFLLNLAQSPGSTITSVETMVAAPPPLHPAVTSVASTNSSWKPRTLNLLPLVDLSKDVIHGKWTADQTGIGPGSRVTPKRLRLPYRPPEEYNLRTEFTVLNGNGDVNLMGSAQSSPFVFILGGWSNTASGFGAIDGQTAIRNKSVNRHGPFFIRNHRHRLEVQVRRGELIALFDGNEISRHATQTNFAEMSVGPDWAVGLNVLGIGTLNETKFHAIEVEEISGPGQVIERSGAQKGAAPDAEWLKSDRTVSLTDIPEKAAQVGFSRFARNVDPLGGRIEVNGKPCEKFLFAHCNSSLLFNIPQGAIGFRAVGVREIHPNGKRSAGAYKFMVYVDANEAFVSPVMTTSPEVVISVPLPPGARQIELRVTGDGTDGHSAWATPEFVVADK